MASRGTVTIRILGDASGFKAAVGDVEGLTGKLNNNFSKIATLAAGVGVSSFFKSAVTAASDLNESVSKTGVIFGDAASGVQKFADKAATSLGQSKQQALEAASTFATLGKLAGLSGQDLAGFSTELTSLASDLASFHNSSPEEAITAIGAALRGESEPIRKFGVLLDDATLRAEALKQGLIRTTHEALTPQQKVLAAHAVIMRQTTDAQGDFARTADGLANSGRALSARFEDLKAKIGQALLPAVQSVVGWLSGNLIPAVDHAAPVFSALVAKVVELAGGLTHLAGPLAGVLPQIALIGAGSVGAVAGVSKLVEAVQSAVKTIGGLVAATSPITAALGVFAAVAGGALINSLVSSAKHAADVKATTEDLSKALRAAQDPAQLAADRYQDVAASLKAIKPPAADAKATITDVGDGFRTWLEGQVITRDLLSDMNKFGVTMESLGEYIKHPTDRLIKYADASKIGEQTTYYFEQRIKPLIEAQKALTEGYQKSAKQTVEAAVNSGRLTQATVDQAMATRGAVSIGETWVALAARVVEADDRARAATAGLAKAQAEHADIARIEADATKGAADAYEPYETMADRAARAAKELDSRVSDLKTRMDDHAAHGRDYEAALDSYRDALQKMADAANDGGTSLSEFTKEGRANRDALRQLEERAQGVVEAIQKAGGAADQQQQALHTLAGEAYNTALQLGYSADEAGRVRDRLLGIPTEIPVTVRLRVEGGETVAQLGANLQARASGGPVNKDQPYLIGEEGPEVMVPDQSGVIIPTDQLRASATGGGVAFPGFITRADSSLSAVQPPVTININGAVGSKDEIVRWVHEGLRRYQRALS